jgi:ribosome-binding factor A
MSPDLRAAVIFILPLGGGKVETALAALTRATPYLRGVLTRMLRLKFAPSLRFRADESFDEAGRIAALLRDPRVAADLGPRTSATTEADDSPPEPHEPLNDPDPDGR